MKKPLHDFMIGQFKRTFQIIYLNGIYSFLYVYVYYIWCYLCRKHIYGVNYAGNGINPIKKNPGFLIISSLILSSRLLYERTGN